MKILCNIHVSNYIGEKIIDFANWVRIMSTFSSIFRDTNMCVLEQIHCISRRQLKLECYESGLKDQDGKISIYNAYDKASNF